MTIINSSTASGVLSSQGISRGLILLSLFIFTPILASAATYYIAPSGSNSNPGTQSAAFATLQKAHDVANPGDTIYMRGGTYFFSAQTTLTRDGASGNRIKVFNYSDESPVIDAAKQPDAQDRSGIILMNSASWWHIKGIEFKNGPVNGVYAYGHSANNTFERLNIHHMGSLASAGGTGTGLRVMGTGGNNLILNNDVHDNEDQLSFGGGANGISVVTSGTGNVIRGNRAWCNSDDGIDMWNAAPALIENNWVSYSGFGINCRSTGGNGVGFKLGGTYGGGDGTENDGGHTLKNNVAWTNRGSEFDRNGGKLPMFFYNNTAWSNDGGTNYSSFDSSDTFRNNISFGSAGLSSGTFNSWNLSVTIDSADFSSTDDACMRRPRGADGSLPHCSFLKLVAGSDLIDKGTNVGIPFTGSAPDLGASELLPPGGTLLYTQPYSAYGCTWYRYRRSYPNTKWSLWWQIDCDSGTISRPLMTAPSSASTSMGLRPPNAHRPGRSRYRVARFAWAGTASGASASKDASTRFVSI